MSGLSLKCAFEDEINRTIRICTFAPLAFERAIVGWVERSDTHQLLPETMMGFAALYPSYEVCNFAPAARSRTVAALRQS